jgi:hypothetical protein
MVVRFLRHSSLILAMGLAFGLSAPAFAGDYHGGGRGFPRFQGMHFGGDNSNFRRDFHGGGNRFASGDAFRYGRGGDGRSHVGGFGNRGFQNGGRNGFARNGNGGFGDDRGFRRNRPQRLYSLNGNGGYGSSVNVILSNQSDYGYISNYSGSADVYRSRNGTYATGYSHSSGQGQQGSTARPRAKIIDVARMGNVCSFENGVCVIRP